MQYASLEEMKGRVAEDEFLQFEERDPCYTWLFPLALGRFDARQVWSPAPVVRFRDDLTLYVHIPFCTFICKMCPFTHEPLKRRDLSAYVDALCSEIAFYAEHPAVAERRVTTLYFGGGTASSLSPPQLERILRAIRQGFRLGEDCEITLECHPRTVDRSYLRTVRELGINRVSFGIQSFSQRNIASLKLHQKVEQSEGILEAALDVAFRTVAMDLMYRYPGQTVHEVEQDLDRALRIGVHGISAYALDSELRELRGVGEAQPAIRTEEEMFYLVRDRLLAEGFVHVAQPDYARPGHENRQLYDLWGAPQAENLSFGAGAFSEWFNGATWANVHQSDVYVRLIGEGRLPILAGQVHSWDDAAARYPALGARCLTVPFAPFEQAFGVPFQDLFRFELKSLADRGLIAIDRNRFTVTRRGCFYIDNISKAFFNLRNRGKSQLWAVQLDRLQPEATYSMKEVRDFAAA